MKALLLISALFLYSCEKCATCTTTITTKQNGSVVSKTQTELEACGDYLKSLDGGTTKDVANIGGVNYVTESKTVCK